jgi:hypothetical protein
MPKVLLTTLSDGSTLYKLSATELASIPTWHGNRIVDQAHIQILHSTVGHPSQFDIKPFHIVRYNAEQEDGTKKQETCIVDGQHRVEVLKKYLSNHEPSFDNPFEDFELLVIEKYCADDQEVQKYFKILNTTKNIEWHDDPRLVANRYLEALCSKFNTKKRQLIRNGKTRRPYVSLEVLRDQMVARRVGFATEETPEAYGERIYKEHSKVLEDLKQQDSDALSTEYKAAMKGECLLGYMQGWDWLDTQ